MPNLMARQAWLENIRTVVNYHQSEGLPGFWLPVPSAWDAAHPLLVMIEVPAIETIQPMPPKSPVPSHKRWHWLNCKHPKWLNHIEHYAEELMPEPTQR